MNKFILLLLFSHVSYTFAETSTITTEAYTADGIPVNDLSCPGSLRRQAFQGNNNYVCRINGVSQPEASHHSHVVNAFTEYRTQMVDYDTENSHAKAPNRKYDACVKLSDRSIYVGDACPDGTEGSITASGDACEVNKCEACTAVSCARYNTGANTGANAISEWRSGRNGIWKSHSGKITQSDKAGTRTSTDMDEYFRQRFVKTKATITVNVAQNEDQIYEGCDVQFDGTSLGDLKDYVEFIPNNRALGTCTHDTAGTIKTLQECLDDSALNIKTFKPIPFDPQCSQETGKCDKARGGAAEFRDEGICTIAVGPKLTRVADYCETADGQVDATKTAATCTSPLTWVTKQDRLGYIQNECGTCRDPGTQEDLTLQYSRKSDCIKATNTWTPATFVKNNDYSCVFYVANNKFVGETSVTVSFHKIPSTVGTGKAIHTISVPVGFSPHGTDKNFREAFQADIIDSELQNKYFRDVAIHYGKHCEHAGNYISPLLTDGSTWTAISANGDNCEAPHSYYDCTPGNSEDGGCTYSEAGTVNVRLSGTFIDTRYKTAAQNGVERLTKDIGDFLILKSGLELHQDYRSFNDPTLNDFSKGNDGTIKLNPIKYDYRKNENQFGDYTNKYSNVGKALIGRCLGNQYGDAAYIKESYCRLKASPYTEVTGNSCGAGANEACTADNCDATAGGTTYEWVVCGGGAGKCSDSSYSDQSSCESADESWIPYVWDAGYPGVQEALPVSGEGSLEDAYKCGTGTVQNPVDLRDAENRGNCYAQYSMMYTFAWTYGALPHFLPGYIGCPLCDNEIIIKGFKEDTDGNGAADTYQINTKIPVSLANTDGLAENGAATNEIDLPGIDLVQVSAAALLEPEMLQKFSFVFQAVEDTANRLRKNMYTGNANVHQKPLSLDDHIDLYSLFSQRSYTKVVPYAETNANDKCAYTDGVCVVDDSPYSATKVYGRGTEFDCLETSGTCKDAGDTGESASGASTKTECEAETDCGTASDPKQCVWTPDNKWLKKDDGAGPLVCNAVDDNGDTKFIRCDLSRNQCIQEDAVASDATSALNIFQYTDGANNKLYGCPSLFKSVCKNQDAQGGGSCSDSQNLKLFRLSADPAASLQALFESDCKMYVPTNGYGSTYFVEFENAYEASLGTCVWTLDDDTTMTLENIPSARCKVAANKVYFTAPAGKGFKSGVNPVHTLNNRAEDQKVISTIKELKAGRFLRLEQTKLSLMQRLEVTQVYQRVATTVNFKISKNTVTEAEERIIFRIRGGSATLDGFTANNPATQLSDECALGPKGQCTMPVYSGDTASVTSQWEHLCGFCCTSIGASGTGLDNCVGAETLQSYKTENQCTLRGHKWMAGAFQPSQPDVMYGYAWKRHTIREYECDDANRDDSDPNAIKRDPLWPCRIINGTCSGGDNNLQGEAACEAEANYKDELGNQLPVGRWYGEIVAGTSSGERSAVNGICMMSFESCERGNNGVWTRRSDPKAELVENLRVTLNTECQPDTLTDGRALQSETLLITAKTNGESIEHSVRTTKECTGTVDLQFEDQALGQDFAIFTSRVPCSRVSSSELKDQVNLKYDWKTSLDIAADRVVIKGRYDPIVETAGECQESGTGEEHITSWAGVLCDNKDACEGSGDYDANEAEDGKGCNKVDEAGTTTLSTKWYKDYTVSTFFGVCTNLNEINSKAYSGITSDAAADVVLNKANCKDTVYIFEPDVSDTADTQFVLQHTTTTPIDGLKTLIDCAETTYVRKTCCHNCKCEDGNGDRVTDEEKQYKEGCEAGGVNTWTQGTDQNVAYPTDDNCGSCSLATQVTKTDCAAAGGTWTGALDPADHETTKDYPYSITTDYMVPSVQTLSESYVITYSLAMQYVRRVRDNAFASANSIIRGASNQQAGTIKYCQDQEFTATIRRDASASVVVAQVKAAELNRAVVVEDIRWIGSSEAAIPGIWGCNQGEYRIEATFMVMDQDARYQDLAWDTSGQNGALKYWVPADLTAAMVDTAADALNPNSMAIKTVVSGIDTVTILRKPGFRCFMASDNSLCTTALCRDSDNVELNLCENTASGGCQQYCEQSPLHILSDQDVPADRLARDNDNYHFKVMGQCVPITQCLTNAEDAEKPIEEVPDGINGNSWADYSQQFIFDLVVRGKFLKSDVDTKIEVTSNFQECPVTASASVTGVPRVGVQLECFEPVNFVPSAVQWVKPATEETNAIYQAEGLGSDPSSHSQECIECHNLPRNYIKIKGKTADDHSDLGLYTLDSSVPTSGFCTDFEQTTETACESTTNTNCGVADVGATKGKCLWITSDDRVCCPMDCAAAYADDLAQTRAKVFVTDALDSDLTKEAYTIADTQGWTIESSEVFIERYDTSTVTATTGATLIGEVRLCVCPDAENPGRCKVDNTMPYGLGSFNTHSTVTPYCKNAAGDPQPTYKTSSACVEPNIWDEGIEEYFMICGGHTNVESDTDNYGKQSGMDNIYDSSNVATDKSTGTDFSLSQINLMPLSEAPADEFRIRYDIILSTTQFNQRRRLRTSTVVRPGIVPKLGDVSLGATAETKGINIMFRPANGVAPKQPSDSGKEESPKHDADKSEPMEAGTVFLIVAAVLIGVGLMIWGSSLFMNKGEVGTVEETTGLVNQVVQNVVRKPRFENLRY